MIIILGNSYKDNIEEWEGKIGYWEDDFDEIPYKGEGQWGWEEAEIEIGLGEGDKRWYREGRGGVHRVEVFQRF